MTECLKAPAACLAGGVPDPDDFTREPLRDRWAIEARLMLQYLYLGLDINNGHGSDDLRFVGGLTVSLDRFFKRQ